jgi:hypothetical protein
MESFFHSLKVELVHQRSRATREEARRDLFGYIAGYYNRQRIHSVLGYLTPEQAEQKTRQTRCPRNRGRISHSRRRTIGQQILTRTEADNTGYTVRGPMR